MGSGEGTVPADWLAMSWEGWVQHSPSDLGSGRSGDSKGVNPRGMQVSVGSKVSLGFTHVASEGGPGVGSVVRRRLVVPGQAQARVGGRCTGGWVGGGLRASPEDTPGPPGDARSQAGNGKRACNVAPGLVPCV